MEQYEKSGCNECAHSESKWDWVDGKFQLLSRNCKLGNTEKLYEWWGKNGTKKRGQDKFDTMDCHEWHESTKILINLSNKASELLEELKKINNGKKISEC